MGNMFRQFSYGRMPPGNAEGNGDNGEEPRQPPPPPEPRNANRDKLLKRIRKYCWFTGQYCSFEGTAENTKRFLYGLWQAMIVLMASLYFAYSSASFGLNMKLDRLSRCFFQYPVSVIEHIVWEFRWLATCLMGIFFTRGIWKDLFEDNKGISLKNIDIEWKKIRRLSWSLLGLLFFMWLVSEFAIFLEVSSNLRKEIPRSDALRIALDAIAALVDRIFAFPLFFLLCITIYILCCMVEEYRDEIETWKWRREAPNAVQALNDDEVPNSSEEAQKEESENLAREKFRKIKAAIRISGLKFEKFLTVHFVLLACSFFLGICSCFEEAEVKIPMPNSTRTVSLPFQIPQSARFIDIDVHRNISHHIIYTLGEASFYSQSLLTASYKHLGLTRAEQAASTGKQATNGTNNSLSPEDQFEELRYELIKQRTTSAWMLMALRTVESVLLYLLPLGLMARLQNRLRRVYEVIEDCNLKEQKEKQCLFDDVEVIRRMCRYVKTAHGLKVYGYSLPSFETFFLAAFMPFITVIIQLLLCHIHMKKG